MLAQAPLFEQALQRARPRWRHHALEPRLPAAAVAQLPEGPNHLARAVRTIQDEEGEAAGKWRRALLSSTQLSTYFVGASEINDIRTAYEAKHGPITDWKAFHDEMLSYGSPPAKFVQSMMGLAE